MEKTDRRNFIGTATVLLSAASVNKALGETKKTGRDASSDMPLGIIMDADEPLKSLKKVTELGFSTCQLSVGEYTEKKSAEIVKALSEYNLKPTSLLCMGPGEYVYDYYNGPLTIGLVPKKYRAERMKRLREGSDFCSETGLPAVCAHFGFIPENPNDELYKEFIETMKDVAGYAKTKNVWVYFETGQETPVTLLRAIEDIGTGNLGVNYDTGNLILYGTANPVDGLDVIGKYVKSLHAKDGIYTTNPKELGTETPIGKGKTNFPAVIRKLKEINFKGHITIERETSGPQQIEDIKRSKVYLEKLIKTV